MRIALLFTALLLGANASAITRYVDVNSATPGSPYTNWATAAVTIQDAIDAANNGDEVQVASGVYRMGGRTQGSDGTTNRVVIDKLLTVKSVFGPATTIIEGYQVPGTTNGPTAIRCVYMSPGAILSGFTLTNGATRLDSSYIGIGVGGGVGGVLFGVVSNCVLVGNSADSYGGGAYGVTLQNCSLIHNVANVGGGAYNCTLNGCLVFGNRAVQRTGGMVQVPYGGGAYSCDLNNCLVISNYAYRGGGAFNSSAKSCTIVSNDAAWDGGGFSDYVVHGLPRQATNSIIIFNTASNSPNYSGSSPELKYCCTTPLATGEGNFSSDPLFVDPLNGDFRLQSNSPCINAGRNLYAVGATDLDGNPRLVGALDVGAYEFQTPLSWLPNSWLQQYGFALDGSDDFADPDGDGHDNWHEWNAGTVPTNASSFLRLLMPTNTPSGSIIIRYSSVNTRVYFIERATDLSSPASFVTISTNRSPSAGFTNFTDGTATNAGQYFYRIRVQ